MKELLQVEWLQPGYLFLFALWLLLLPFLYSKVKKLEKKFKDEDE